MKSSLLFCLTLYSLFLKAEFKNITDYSRSVDLCFLEKKTGSCNKSSTRYYYDSLLKRCTFFTYSGCDGNANNFPTRQDCDEKCPGKYIQTWTPLHCTDQPDEGPCKERILSFFYKHKADDCQFFYYGGCGGNNNRYTSLEDCYNECRTHEFSLKIRQ